ncbi:MAG: hypothetical protein AVDCRST_MAG22-3713 [uncultured Rubrobacteraceae bacterium]|uniref:Uncharacterized protein n=1 Tax=uncultured Rubrobacteraceae bacterium TaxID=349277 RepID=A0A6J4Q933_9ACTN|nr:MAG: hypothetical protein AVDCRST_MAG22-3713 [uncultured Rubrobacteraceae bacterium]
MRRADSSRLSLGDRPLVENDDPIEGSEMLKEERLPARVFCRGLAGP